MSFEHTPINDIRRLPHSQFLKHPSHTQRNPKPLPPTAAIYSQPAPVSPIRDADDDPPALTRFYRQKQEQAASRPGAPKTITSPLRPNRWDLPDTTVNIAGAFNSAMNTANQSWSSTTSQPPPRQVGRGTSVEYEDGAANASRRLQISKPGSSSRTRKPLSKNGSLTVPDSEGEEERPSRLEREKSPFMEIVDTAKSAFGTATFFAKQRLMELGEPPRERERETSYDYENEQREYENQSARRTKPPTSKRNRMSEDNRAYLPDQSDLESDEDYEDDGKTKRRKKKKKEPAGSMNHLPVIAPEKRRKKKQKDKKGTTGGAEDEASDSDEASIEQISTRQRGSLRPDIARHPSLPRELHPPDDYALDTSMDIEQGLDSIPEADEEELVKERPRGRERERERQSSQRRSISRQRRSISRQRSSRIGGPLGRFVNFIFRKLFALVFVVWQLLTSVLYLSGGLTANVYDMLFRRPLGWMTFVGAAPLLRTVTIGLLLSGLYSLRQPLLQYLPVPRLGGPPQPMFQASEIPAANIAELAARLQAIETALAGLSSEAEKRRVRAESDGKTQLELAGRLGVLENKVGAESRKAVEVEMRVKEATRDTFGVVKQEIEVLHAQIQAVQQQRPSSPSSGHGHGPANDEEARARVKALEERVGSVEGGVKEALELGRKVTSAPSDVDAGAAWWNKLTSGSAANSGLTIKSSDGQDVTSLIEHLVDTAVLTYSKDTIARADYALHSGGARVVPSLTSPTYEIKPKTLRGSILSMITGGTGHAIGRPPVWALHHELHNGHCWPVAGQSGQLGVALAAPIYIDEVSVDHIAEEVAFDMRSAPREMELWGLVEGEDNVEKVLKWKEERRRRREVARENGEVVEEEPEVPSTLPPTPMYVRVAEFAYDIHAPRHVQTFPVDPELRALGVDFGVVVLMMKSNWGREYTCLYRLRVHGQRIDQASPVVVGEEEKV